MRTLGFVATALNDFLGIFLLLRKLLMSIVVIGKYCDKDCWRFGGAVFLNIAFFLLVLMYRFFAEDSHGLNWGSKIDVICYLVICWFLGNILDTDITLTVLSMTLALFLQNVISITGWIVLTASIFWFWFRYTFSCVFIFYMVNSWISISPVQSFRVLWILIRRFGRNIQLLWNGSCPPCRLAVCTD